MRQHLRVEPARPSASRVPERLAPGKFDYAGSSHQIFHLLVVLGVYQFYDAMNLAYAHRLAISSASGQC